MWRHLSIVVVALNTVVQCQRVKSKRWRFNFENNKQIIVLQKPHIYLFAEVGSAESLDAIT